MLPPEGAQTVRVLNQPKRAKTGAPRVEGLARGAGGDGKGQDKAAQV